ncbi:helix-turn-helix transcriptional regulator [Pseudomonas aeruginosa]|uniref:Helix-turn-helix transcriptional regulator n=1 Tax=Pseudomonas aeruginosa TaxID=287 RepID=A0A6A9JT24_PSEAI|nr:helix-turn-helix transcriptional regulator [Pseudomonas aeruginosa]MBG7461273.1 helix-turn-helix transcriptional regulator [Pseudomonas aeruginosa]MDG3711703.1 helix-turn-helix transcriptional regulator [Pseudomonas aeruginosa]MDG3816251.1 helix-turn-helix transcriptional regulator [Pseudomonas aeruginosa]MUI56826.1 helix-turn-helix transcriptional regulator [Pseudomonas aeruginosa]RCM87996.1 ATP-dependent transcriptional regulator [Pseudomonas aeruginosa]
MAQSLTLEQFSGMLGDLYQGPLETTPWQSFLNALNQFLAAKYVTFILRPPSDQSEGLMINTNGSSAAVVTSYNQYYFSLDPFVDLPTGKVATLDEFVCREEWLNSEFYRNFLEPVGVFHILGADIGASDGARCRIRVSRGLESPGFTEQDKAMLAYFLPHLERSVSLHTQINRIETERNLYAGAVDQFAVGTIILDENGKILQTNQVANRLLKEKDGLKISADSLQVGTPRDCQEFRRLVKQALQSQQAAGPSVVEAMRVQRPSGRTDLGIIVRSVPLSEWNEGKHCPSVVIFVSDPEQESSAPQEIVKALFDLTPAEAHLAMLLANGLTLDEASEEQGISRNTARAHLRSTFSKTGVTRQTMLVRLILRSVATLG